MRLALLAVLLISCFAGAAQSIPNYREPLLVSHLSGTNKTMIRRAGAPKHNTLAKVVCFKFQCRGVIGWTRTQQRNKFRRYKKGPSIPRLKYLKQDSLRRAEPQGQPVAPDTTTAVAPVAAEPVMKDTTMNFVFDDLLFDTNSSELKGSFAKHLDSLAGFIVKYDNYSILVVGHTDNSGSERSNGTLSQDRADAVAAHLVSKGIDRGVVAAEGRGSKEPVADNRLAEGRRKNRRVEIFLSLR